MKVVIYGQRELYYTYYYLECLPFMEIQIKKYYYQWKKEFSVLIVKLNLYLFLNKVPEFKGVSDLAKDLIKKMIIKPENRLTA